MDPNYLQHFDERHNALRRPNKNSTAFEVCTVQENQVSATDSLHPNGLYVGIYEPILLHIRREKRFNIILSPFADVLIELWGDGYGC